MLGNFPNAFPWGIFPSGNFVAFSSRRDLPLTYSSRSARPLDHHSRSTGPYCNIGGAPEG